MKKLLFIISLFICDYAQAGIYINNNIKPYIGINFGFNILDYTINTELDNKYTSATITAGTRIGNNFGAELFFSHSAKNSIQYITDLDTLDHEIYYQSFGFDLFGYYKISKEFDFFTTFGVANYKILNKFDYTSIIQNQTEKTTDNTVSTRIGLGLMYTFFNDDASVLFKYQYTPINNDLIRNMSEFSIGVRYIF